MLAVFVIWGLDTEGDAENPVFNLCWGRFKRVGKLLNLLIMKKMLFEKFKESILDKSILKSVVGGYNTCTWGGSASSYGSVNCTGSGGGCNAVPYGDLVCLRCGGPFNNIGACKPR
jgi:hypothetical protein